MLRDCVEQRKYLWLVSRLVDCGHVQIVGTAVTLLHTRGHAEHGSTLLMNIISDRERTVEGRKEFNQVNGLANGEPSTSIL
jgi:hypothetical protein